MLTSKERIAIAKDVIEQIELNEIIVACGVYFESEGYVGPKLDPNQPLGCRGRSDLQTVLKKGKLKNCRVCARGALVLAKARLFNALPVELDGDGTPYLGGLKVEKESYDFFGEDAIEIECCFEGWNDTDDRRIELRSEDNGGPIYNHRMIWVELYPDPARRLKELMRNVVRNEGEFVVRDYVAPEPKPKLKVAKKPKAKPKAKAKAKVTKK